VAFEVTAAGEQAWNAAALARGTRDPLARIWIWPKPAIVLGRGQLRHAEAVRLAAGGDIEVVVRGSGGGAVLTGPWMIGASIVLPVGHPLLGKGLVDAYRWLGQAYLRVLSDVGVPARLLAPQQVGGVDAEVAGGPLSWACFGGLSPWELVDASGRKIVGLAQQRRREAVLLVSGMLARTPPWALLCAAMQAPQDETRLAARTVSIEALSGRTVDAEALQGLAAALETQVSETLGRTAKA
jgi:lipoate-protein ligase A